MTTHRSVEKAMRIVRRAGLGACVIPALLLALVSLAVASPPQASAATKASVSLVVAPTVKVGKTIPFTGTVKHSAARTIKLQALSKSKWRTVVMTTANKKGQYRLTSKMAKKGTFTFRVLVYKGSKRVATSPTRKVGVVGKVNHPTAPVRRAIAAPPSSVILGNFTCDGTVGQVYQRHPYVAGADDRVWWRGELATFEGGSYHHNAWGRWMYYDPGTTAWFDFETGAASSGVTWTTDRGLNAWAAFNYVVVPAGGGFTTYTGYSLNDQGPVLGAGRHCIAGL